MAGRPRIYDWDALAGDLLDLLASNPAGLDRYEIEEELGLAHPYHVAIVVRRLRQILGATHAVNVVVYREGWRSIYQLATDLEQVKPWTRTRGRDHLSGLETMAAVYRSMVAGSDGRSLEGRIFRHTLKCIERLVEDIRDELVA